MRRSNISKVRLDSCRISLAALDSSYFYCVNCKGKPVTLRLSVFHANFNFVTLPILGTISQSIVGSDLTE